MRTIIVQPAIPAYRSDLFRRMAERIGPEFVVYSSKNEALGVLVAGKERPAWRRDIGPMRPLQAGLEWQEGALSVPVSKGDILVVCGAPRAISTLALIFWGKLKGARTIWWGHYWSATSKPWRAALRFALMRLPDAIIFYTDQEVAEYLAQRGNKSGGLVFGLNNGVETSEIIQLRAPYDPAKRARDLLFIGRITEKASLGLMLEAMVRPECANVTLDVIGDGPKLAELQNRAVELGLVHRIVWHYATVDEAYIAKVANRCKLFVYPGSVGLSLIHGLAYGLPAIVHEDRWTQMPEFAALRAGENGVTFKRGQADDLALKISERLSDEASLGQLSASAIAVTDESYNTADMAERFIAIINAVRV